jgi:hypothetical protein
LGAPDEAIDPPTRRALCQSWLSDGLDEHASVAAFARFTLHLLAVAAPPDLIARAQAASLDEVRHARQCFGLAARFGGLSLGPAELPMEGALGAIDFSELVALTVQEGCVGETLGVLLAAEQLSRATDAGVRRVLSGIVRDEVRHAELAWAFLRWALQTGSANVRTTARSALREAIAKASHLEVRPSAVDLAVFHAYGRLDCEEVRAVARRGVTQVLEPCADAI